MPVTSTALAADVGKWISDELIDRQELLFRLFRYTEKVNLPGGMGKTANFTKYNRTDVPVDKLTEGVTPVETPFTISTQTVTVDQWGLYISLTDVGVVTIKTPILNEALDLVADAMARCREYNLIEVLNAGTNVQYWDGSVANRGALTTSHTFGARVFNRVRATMNDQAVPGRAGDLFIAVMGAQVEADIFSETAAGSFVAAHQNAGNQKLEKGEVGDWLGVRIVRQNFMPKFTRLTAGITPAAGAGGALSGTVYHKVTRKNLSDGFEDEIAVEANTAMGGNNRLAFTAPATAGFVYNIYAGSATGDANLFLVRENLTASATFNLDSLPGTGANPPQTPAAGVTVHPIYIFGARAVDNVEINALSMAAGITPAGRSDADPLAQRRKVGAKWMNKAGIRDQTRVMRIEVASGF